LVKNHCVKYVLHEWRIVAEWRTKVLY
jgi:hypothetical protein